MFVIEDGVHAEWCGEFPNFIDALSELHNRSEIAWNQRPNACPCTNWENCEREYSIIEFDTSTEPWRELSRIEVLKISSKGVFWEKGFERNTGATKAHK